jgi:O-antigen/teichoic acid export membrane protein
MTKKIKAAGSLVVSSGLTLVFVTLISILTAYILGPKEFGLYAALQAVAVVMMPLVSLRLETRVAVCTSEEDLNELSTAVSSASLIYLTFSGVSIVCLWPWINGWTYLLVALLSAGMVLADFGLSRLAFGEQHGKLAAHRFVRQLMPVALALFAAQVSPQHLHVLAALVVGTWTWALVLMGPKSRASVWSWQTLQSAWHRYRDGLKASVVLGGLNGMWLNGLQPLMAWLGWHQLAGQYALLQRLINAPLGVLSVVVNTFLMAKGNALHTQRLHVLRLCAGLAALASLWVGILWVLLYGQDYWHVPDQWIPDPEFFNAAAFFGVCSFAVGTVSVVSIRLHDEWFVAGWQLLFMTVWAITLCLTDLQFAFSGLLYLGGLAYGVLMWRWLTLMPAEEI